ncbi:hypothetical protein TNCV_4953781, partial [Trichonephila clavipes]
LNFQKNCYNISTLPCLEHRLKYLRNEEEFLIKGRCNKSNDGCGESNSTVPKNSADEKNCADGAKLCTNETEPSASERKIATRETCEHSMAEAVREAVDENDGKRTLLLLLMVAGRSVVFLRRMAWLQRCKMEVAGALSIFSVPSLSTMFGTQKYLGDGDSKAFTSIVENKVYGDHCSVEKLECIGHVMKRMGHVFDA